MLICYEKNHEFSMRTYKSKIVKHFALHCLYNLTPTGSYGSYLIWVINDVDRQVLKRRTVHRYWHEVMFRHYR